MERKYEIWFPSIVKNFVRKLANHTFNSTFHVRFKRVIKRHIGGVWYDCLERKKQGAKADDTEKESVHIKKSIMVGQFHVRFKRGMSRPVGVVWYDCLERKKGGAKANDTEKESVHIKKSIMMVNLHILGSLCTQEGRGGYQLQNKIVTHCLSLYLSQCMSPGTTLALPMNLDSK